MRQLVLEYTMLVYTCLDANILRLSFTSQYWIIPGYNRLVSIRIYKAFIHLVVLDYTRLSYRSQDWNITMLSYTSQYWDIPCYFTLVSSEIYFAIISQLVLEYTRLSLYQYCNAQGYLTLVSIGINLCKQDLVFSVKFQLK